MNIFELFGKISLQGTDQVKGQLSSVEQKTQKLQGSLRAVGAGFTAVGIAGLKLTADAQKLNARIGVTATTFGNTATEMRGMVLETANVTFSIDEVTKSFDMLSRAGVRDEETLKATSTAFDTLGDAIGMSASEVTDIMVPAMKTFRLTAEEAAGKVDLMTYMVRNSTIDLEDFNTMVGYTSQDMVDAGLTIEDMAAAMMYMSDQGVEPGKVMLREWNKAVTKSQDENIALTEALGMTNAELLIYQTRLEGATGITQKYADVANTQYGIMDKLKFQWSVLSLRIGTVLTPLQPVFALMTAMGPAMIFLSTSAGKGALTWMVHAGAVMKSHVSQVLHIGSTTTLAATTNLAAGATTKATIAQVGLNRAMMANPIIAIIAGITAAVFAIKYLWDNWQKVTIDMDKTWLKMKNTISGGLPTYQAEMDALDLEQAWQRLSKTVKDSQDQINADVKMGTDQAIANAQRVADQEKQILDTRAGYYRDLTADRLMQIDEQMLAELAAMDPTGAVAKMAQEFYDSQSDRKEEGVVRDRELEEDRITALKKELKDGDDLSAADKRRIKDQILDMEEGWVEEEEANALHLAIMELDADGYFEGQKTEIDNQTATQVAAYEADLVNFEQLNIDKLANLRKYVTTYNEIMAGAGMKPSVELGEPGVTQGAPGVTIIAPGVTGEWQAPEERERPSNPLEAFNWAKDWMGERMANGGTVTEPSLVYGLKSQRFNSLIAESGPERVGGGGDTYQVTINNPVVREESDIRKITQQVAIELGRFSNRRMRLAGQ